MYLLADYFYAELGTRFAWAHKNIPLKNFRLIVILKGMSSRERNAVPLR